MRRKYGKKVRQARPRTSTTEAEAGAEAATLCFEPSAKALKDGRITVIEYLENYIAHVVVNGVCHQQDRSNKLLKRLVSDDPLAGAFKTWILSPNFEPVKEKDASILKDMLQSAWTSDDLIHLRILNEELGTCTGNQFSAFKPPLLQVFIALAYVRRHLSLLSHLLTLPPPPKTIFDIIDLSSWPPEDESIETWTVILNSEWIHRPHYALHRRGLYKMLVPHLGEDTSASLEAFDAFVKALKSRNVSPILSLIYDVIFCHPHAVSKTNVRNLSSLFSYFPASSLPVDTIRVPVSSPNCLLVAAAKSNNKDLEVLRVLLDAGLDPNWICPKFIYQIMLDFDPRDGRPEDFAKTERETALHIVAEQGDVKWAQLLLEYGADVQLEDGLGKTVDMRAQLNGKEDMVRFLRSHGGGYCET